MEKGEGDSKTSITNSFDLKTELSALVENKVISPKIAEKLEQKISEKNIKLDKDNLNILVSKIKDTMKNFSKFEQTTKKSKQEKAVQPINKKTEEDMLNLIQKIEKLEQKINNFENINLNKDINLGKKDDIIDETKQSPKFVTQEDIKVPNFIEGDSSGLAKDPLTQLPNDPESIIVLMKWLQHLIDKCGHVNLSKILDYYVDIDWITPDVKINLLDYSLGITEDKGKEDTIKKKISDLPSKDHIQSYIFIQKLKGNQFDKHFIDRIDNDISRITKKISEYKFI
jgi:flagellar protein FlaD